MLLLSYPNFSRVYLLGENCMGEFFLSITTDWIKLSYSKIYFISLEVLFYRFTKKKYYLYRAVR